MWCSWFRVLLGSAEALVRCGAKIKFILIAYFLGNIYAKNCRNRIVCVKIIASCKGGTFFWDTVYIHCWITKNIQYVERQTQENQAEMLQKHYK